MAKKNVKANTKAKKNAEAIAEVAARAKEVLLFTASRGNNKRFAWADIEVNEGDAVTKVKGVAAEIPVQAAEVIGNDKFVAYIDRETVERAIAEGKPVRGMASTVSDVYNRYAKVTNIKGEKAEIAIAIFKAVIEAINAGNKNGEWVREEEEAAEPEAPAEEG